MKSGNTNKAVTTEEDLGSYPGLLQDRIAQAFDSTIVDNSDANGAKQAYRDSFQYFAEYNGRVLPLDVLENDHILTDLVKKIKERLHFRKTRGSILNR